MAEELRPGVGTNVPDLPGQRFATRSSVRDMVEELCYLLSWSCSCHVPVPGI